MTDEHFPSPADGEDVFGPLPDGERRIWRGRCGVAEYAFEEAASLPRWTLPEGTDVLVTDQRVLYAHTGEDGHQKSGELHWLWPQYLRVQPGARSRDRGAAATQIQMVCGGADGTWPALVFAGGDLATVGDADRLANLIRQAIASFRVDHAEELGLATSQARMLSRMLIGPEFRNHQGGEGQTVSLLGAMPVNRPAPVRVTPPPAPVSEPAAQSRPVAEGTRLINRPGRAADAARALLAAKAEAATAETEPDLASRAAELAARVASMVSHTPAHAEPDPMDAPVEPERFEMRTTDLAGRAEAVRRTAARMAANSARTRVGARHADRDTGISTRGNGG